MDLNKNAYYDQGEMAVRKTLVGVYGWMTLALIVTAMSALFALTSPAVLSLYPVWTIAELAIVLFLSFRINKMSSGAATISFLAYSVLNGLTLSSIFYCYSLGSIFQAFIVTAGLFAIMTLYGMITKTDLTSIGNLFVMGLFGLILATFVNMFFRNQGLDLAITYIGVVIFIGLIGYDTQKIKQLAYAEAGYGGAIKNASILGALTLYLDFINLFLRLVRLFARRDD